MKIKQFLGKDYMVYNTKKILKIRVKIQSSSLKIYRLVLSVRYRRLLLKMQSFLPLSKTISNRIVYPHGLSGIFISNGATVEDGCVIFQQVTIGSNTLSDSKNEGFPKIGKNCYIGAGAKIIGNVKIGNNVRIGANTVVTKDVPDNVTVVGAKCRVIEHDYELKNQFVAYKRKGKKDEK